LDIGTNSIKVALGEINHLNAIQVVGLVQVPSGGLRKGNIVDIESTARAIETGLNELEKITGMEIMSAIVGFSGISISSINNHAVIAVGSSNYEISREETAKVLHAAQNMALAPDKTVVQVVERQYIVDGYDGVKDPVGMVGNRLEAETLTIIAATAALQNLHRSCQRITLHVDQLVYSQLLAAEAVLMPAEKEMGVALVDMGGGTTEVSIFEQGSILTTSVLPIGGDYITKDLAIILKTSIEEAARIKENYGLAAPEMVRNNVMIDISNLQGNQTKQVQQQLVAQIISARLLEMLEMIFIELQRITDLDNLPGGLVLTGGGAQLSGVVELMEDYLDVPVRLGKPANIIGLKDEISKPQNTVALGGLIYGFNNLKPMMVESKPGVSRVFNRINYWFQDLFA
jgi:cell division protein FtsA